MRNNFNQINKNNMKKLIVSVVVMIATISMSNAQYFVGGNLGMNLSGGKAKGGSTAIDLPSTFSIDFSPKVGFHLDDDFAVGLKVGLSNKTIKTPKEYSGYSDDRKESSSGWQVGAFARYNILRLNKFSVLLEGSVGVAGVKTKTKVGSVTTDGNPASVFAIGVLPVLSYSLTDRLSIETSCDFLELGFVSATVKNANDKKIKATSNSFGLGINNGTNSIVSDLLNVGLIFKF